MSLELLERTFVKIFDLFDTEQAGCIDQRCFDRLAQRVSDSLAPHDRKHRKEIRKAYRQFWSRLREDADANRDGRVSRAEYMAAIRTGLLSSPDYVSEVVQPITKALWDALDSNGDNQLSAREYARILSLGAMTTSEAMTSFRLLDANGDGYLVFEEFKAAALALFEECPPDSKGIWLFGQA